MLNHDAPGLRGPAPTDDRFSDRVAELMQRFPFYGEEKARARATLELQLVDEMARDVSMDEDF